MSVLRTYFDEVRFDIKEEMPQWRDFYRDQPLKRAFLAALDWLRWGPSLRYPHCEAYLFGPDGLMVCHVGEQVERLFVVLYLTPESKGKVDLWFAETGWTRRQQSWRDWPKST